MLAACIFDLDGVLTDTAKFHYLAWKEVAQHFNYNLTEEDNEKLKGVSRLDSLLLMLEWANTTLSETEINRLLEIKNQHYLVLIEDMSASDVFDGVLGLFKSCGDSRELSKMRKEVESIKDSTYTKTELGIELKIMGLESEKRMIQATDRKLLDVQ